ncbi:sigma-70 family RNA polymerase sigma factor [Clostridium aminobutyricum]|uniref:RNA polymerase sigma factor n=1 Tax=Clostridium aminobutyricum TaxID=33953 RepID=A0A939D7Z8_CLOAM|nr:sigma-70 family RNA polymerase sigma factor [Clostridium aminobutyricum]MBN7772762.1 sigma-70 family RNA polymerase sigma factor [Clostridium aminobutyricum]
MSYSYNINKEDTYALIERAKNGDEEARELLVSQNTGLVKSLALKYLGTGYELEDLVQIGYMGLLKSIERFDASYDVMFSTYAVPMILGEIKRYIRDDGRIKVSRQMKLEIKQMNQIRDDYYNQHGVYPKLSVISKEMGIPSEKVLELIEAADALYNVASIDDPESSKQYSTGSSGEGYHDEESNLVDAIYLKNIIGRLAEKERKIIILRYFRDMTQQQIADLLGISQVQVSRIEKRVLEGIRTAASE